MPEPAPAQPVSLTGHVVPEERLALIRQHVAALAETALAVSDTLPLGADSSDMIRVIEAEEERT
ncbi:MAG: hypothetical protein R3D27_14500 [Hyphomicrobiaceae bacterium]